MPLTLKSVAETGLGETAAVLGQGFSDYLIPLSMDRAGLMHRLAADGIDAASSQVVLRDNQPVGVALIARRGWSSRLAGMAVVPAARGQGIGQWLMARLIEQAQARGERRMVLEVIEGNTAAVHLYEKSGFHIVRRLLSFAGTPTRAGESAALEEIDLVEVAHKVIRYGLPDLPWQLSGESLALVGPPSQAFRLAQAYVAVSSPEASGFAFRSLLVEPAGRDQGQATRLLQTLAANYPDKEWIVPALCPEEAAGPFEKMGLKSGPLVQYQMVLEWY